MSQQASIRRKLIALENAIADRFRRTALLTTTDPNPNSLGRAQGQHDTLEMLRAMIADCDSLGLFDEDDN